MTRRVPLPWLRVGGRLLVLGLLLLALVPPPLPWTRSPAEVIAVVDESLSMPRDFTDRAWRQLRELLAAAPPDSRLRLIRFAATPELETTAGTSAVTAATRLPREKALDRSATDIAAALQAALRMAPADRPAIMVLVSDTAATHGATEAALRAVSRAGIPLYLQAPRAGESSGPARLRDLQVPPRANAGERVPVVAMLDDARGGPAEVILEIDGQVRSRQRLDLLPDTPALAYFELETRTPGVRLVTVGVEPSPPSGDGGRADSLTRAVNVLGPAPLLYIAAASGTNPLVANLRAAGWQVSELSPAGLTARPAQLREAGAIILDDIAIEDMPEAAWRSLVTAVRVDGRGLAVLGGPRSFGAGAYRHSTLEQILPVTAEAADPQEAAAVVFLLDTSGSMGREQAGPSRLSLARRAVAEAMEMLLPDDQLGLVTFATGAQLRLPLAPRRAGGDQVAAALDVTAGGGTRLGPALQLAAEQLRGVEAAQRLIVLVTDGFTADEDLQSVARELQIGGIGVIALAVGRDPNRETLRLLTGFNGGRILPVSDAATLPRLMSGAVATRRAPQVAGATLPVMARALPFPLGPALTWPPLSGYMVSKARPAAQVYLRSGRGDPLFATGLAGAGRVVVLPAGLGQWAAEWWDWPPFGAFPGGLMQWLDPGREAGGLWLAVRDEPGALLFSLDLQPDGAWDPQQAPTLLVDDPAGGRTDVSLALQAAGQYQARLPATLPGLYRATLHAGGQTLRHAVYRNANDELHSAVQGPAQRHAWLERGWLEVWPGADQLLAAWPRDAAGLRRWLLLLALLSFLLLLALERGLARPVARWLGARFSR